MAIKNKFLEETSKEKVFTKEEEIFLLRFIAIMYVNIGDKSEDLKGDQRFKWGFW